MRNLTKTEKLILSGLFFSKFDKDGLRILGFDSFAEAFNTIALSLDAKSTSLKNYRDEFDPYFPNPRKGWHNRPIRESRKAIMEEFSGLNIYDFAGFLKSQISSSGEIEILKDQINQSGDNSFAKRLMTGQAAENYFEKTYIDLPEFQYFKFENTTMLGCGFDYKMVKDNTPFLAVEVKGITTLTGTLMLTNKEYETAKFLKNRYYLFVVRNFYETPSHILYQNPLYSGLKFDKRESAIVQISWSANISS